MPDPNDPDTADTGDGQPWHPSPEQLQRHLEDQLPSDESARIADHLDGCTHCVDTLDTLAAPPALSRATEVDTPMFDERRMRRAVRRTLLRTAFNAAALVLIGAIVLQALGGLMLDPLLVARGERVPQSVVASIDLPIMTSPGSEVVQVLSNPGVIRRTIDVEVERPIGAETTRLGRYTARIGPLGMSTPDTATVGTFGPRLSEQTGDRSTVPFEPDRLGEGTAATVHLAWDDARAHDDANAVADAAEDLALLWVGFRTPTAPPGTPWMHLGYGACHAIPDHVRDWEFGGSGTSGGFRTFPPDPGSGAQHALQQLRRATTNLAATGWLDNEPVDGALADMDATADWLEDNDPDVASIVITGPTQSVAAAAEASGADHAALLEVDFDRGAPQPCG